MCSLLQTTKQNMDKFVHAGTVTLAAQNQIKTHFELTVTELIILPTHQLGGKRSHHIRGVAEIPGSFDAHFSTFSGLDYCVRI